MVERPITLSRDTSSANEVQLGLEANAQQPRLTDRVSFKLARVTVMVALLVALGVSSVQVFLDYLETNGQLEEIVRGSLQSADKPATRAVLLIDPLLANEVVSGLFEYDYIVSARIVDEKGQELAAAERDALPGVQVGLLSMLLADVRRVYDVPLELPERINSNPGRLEVTVDRNIGLEPFFDRAFATITSGFVHSVILAFILYIAFHRGITRPLSSLLDRVSNINPDQPGEQRITVAASHKKDELGRLAAQINLSFDAVQVLLDNLRSTNRALTSSEEALRRRSWELEQEVERTKQTTLELIATKEQAEAANRAKSVFLANVSHELRTPLNAIIGFSSIMSQEMFGPIGHDRYRGYLDDIRTSSEHLSDVLGEVLDLAKIEAGQIKLEEETIDVAELCHQCVALVSTAATNKKLSVTFEHDDRLPHLFGDRLRIKQTLLNLLSNAIKFSPRGGEPVGVRAFVTSDGEIAISVRDHGVGIAKEEQELVFSPFIRSSSALSRTHEGTGLGLALVKSFMDKHSGRIELESDLGQGSTFTVIYPSDRIIRAQKA